MPVSNLDMEPLLLTVPQQSGPNVNQEEDMEGYLPWDRYLELIRQRGAKLAAYVVTNIKYGLDYPNPKLLFTFVRWLEVEEAKIVSGKVNAEKTKALLATGDED